jgi:hypothetical protein
MVAFPTGISLTHVEGGKVQRFQANNIELCERVTFFRGRRCGRRLGARIAQRKVMGEYALKDG